MQALHIFKYLEIYSVNDLAFDPFYQRVTSNKYIQSKFQAMKDVESKFHQMPQNQE